VVTTAFEREIREQPAVLGRLLDGAWPAAEAAAAELRRARPAFVTIAARGSSDNAARYAQYLLGARHRLAVALAAPSLHTRYGAPPDLSAAVAIGISQSGRSPDVLAVIEDARREGAPAIAITNDPGSPLARAATVAFDLGAGEETAVAASKSYTAQLAALAMISAALGGGREELAALPDAVTRALAAPPPIELGARCVVLGRGYNLSTAHEIALKLKETAYVQAEACSWTDFLHGPAAMVEAGLPVILVAPSSPLAGDVPALLDLLEERGARAAVISDRADLLARGAALPVPALPEWLSPIAAVVPGQLLALAQATARGVDPDAPRGLTKVTETR
jgi:glucosamine--fructose-6-phosphate aminotransferase (isomerizing)